MFFYESIIFVLKLSAGHAIPTSDTSTKYNIVPGWNKYVKEHHSLAKDAQWWWKLNNRPSHEHIYDNMRVTRAHFKYALRFVRNANVIDGVSGPDSIASHWKQHFDKLLNVYVHVNSDNSLKDDI